MEILLGIFDFDGELVVGLAEGLRILELIAHLLDGGLSCGI